MTNANRCEPPLEWRHIRGRHWLKNTAGELFWDIWDVDNGEWWERGRPDQSGIAGCTYVAPVTYPATVAALVEALEEAVDDMEAGRESYGLGNDGPIERARAALDLYREAGR